MAKSIQLIIANPAGNITAMVLTPAAREEYTQIAAELLKIDFSRYCSLPSPVFAEQVCFVLQDKIIDGISYPAMEMCGLEFCGNASRSFAYYKSAYCGYGNNLMICVSGCNHPLEADVDTDSCTAGIQMPVPTCYRDINMSDLGIKSTDTGILVDMDGISHLILADRDNCQDYFDTIRINAYKKINPDMEAFGVMLLNEDRITPVVYVRDVDTTYFEGSCASGTAAAAFARTLNKPEGVYEYIFRQPEGILETTVSKAQGKVTDIRLHGSIELSDIISVEI